jgi:hypothetical protein
MSLSGYEAKLEAMLALTSAAAPALGRAHKASRAARARADAYNWAGALRVLRALPPEGRRRLERDPAGGAGDDAEAAAAAAAGVPLGFARIVLEGYSKMRLAGVEKLRRSRSDGSGGDDGRA